MSETGEGREYYAAAEAAFVRRRGTPFLLSPKDFALLKEWRALGVPLEAVESGIEEAFARVLPVQQQDTVLGLVEPIAVPRRCRQNLALDRPFGSEL
jgi:hypothetical protein